MKQYCKRVNIESIHFIQHCIFKCLEGKWSRSDVHALLAEHCKFKLETIREYAMDLSKRDLLRPAIDSLALSIQKCIHNRSVNLPPARTCIINDGISKKVRKITIACMLQQIYDYIAKIGLQELFDVKFAPHQYATIKGRGQTYGLKFNERWVRERKRIFRSGEVVKGKPVSTYAVEADVRQCYPTISIGKLKKLLRRDVRNEPLLWLTFLLIDKMSREQKVTCLKPRRKLRLGSSKKLIGFSGFRVKKGLSIGSYLSCNLCNYMISYAWHFIQENAFRWEVRKGKDGVYRRKRKRLITHCGIYMDNIYLFGSNKRDLMRARQILEAYMRKTLGMRLKRNWRLFHLAYKDKTGKEHGSPIDSMGYVVYPDRTIMRGRIFIRARRKYLKADKCRRKHERPSRKLCGAIVSYNGWFSHTDSRKWRRANDFKHHTFATARRNISLYAKEENKHDRSCGFHGRAIAG